MLVKSQRGVFKKPSSVIMARNSDGLELRDLKLFHYLLQRAYRNLLDQSVHRIPVRDAMEYLRLTSSSRLHESLDNLGKVNIEIDYVDQAGDPHTVVAHYLSFDVSKAEDGVLHYAFDPILLDFLKEPRVYALLNIVPLQKFKTLHASRLYEVMQLNRNLIHPTWKVTVDEAREFFGVQTGYERWDNLRRRVIEKAVQELNDVADFDVEVEYIRGGKGGRVQEIHFTPVIKGHERLMDTREVLDPVGRVRGQVRDPHTVDFLDGQTDSERGSSFVLRQETLEEASKIAGVPDVSSYEFEWREDMYGRIVRDHDASFLSWLKIRIEREKDEALIQIDDDTFGSILEQMD